ncbi:hypothetical protein GCM10023191_054400 [Actinoallomurus oryzae]|jgi:hypothetical protein|uniref:Uncharacterized protein n=1 Tax=Actinoallomurus oryzae TaxID=502180 RepID=A0ABP8QG39_9ACTN
MRSAAATPADNRSRYDRDLANNHGQGTKRKTANGASSMKNTTPCNVILYDVPYTQEQSDEIHHAKPKPEDTNFANNGFDNKASIFRR